MQHHIRVSRTVAVLCFALAVPAAPAEARSAPKIQQLVVYKSGKAVEKTVTARGLKAKVGSRRCTVGTATPLAGLLRSKVARLGLRDYGSCSSKARDSGQLYVRSIGSERARGNSGWVYKVGNRSASSGAADTSGPLGRGLLRSKQRVTWFYGTQRGDSFQRTLTLAVKAGSLPGTAIARVRSYDDEGRGRAESGATVTSGAARATTGADGTATLGAGAGKRRFVVTKRDLIRSFTESATIR